MRRTRIERWCDFCWQDGGQEVAAADNSFVIAAAVAGPKPPPAKLLEPCEMHAKMLTDLITVLNLAIPYRPEEFKVAAKPHPAKPPATATAAPVADAAHTGPASERPTQCRECGVAPLRRDLPSHIWAKHVGRTKPPAPTHCPDCGAHAPATAKLPTMWTARHRANEHGYDALEDAYAHVAPASINPDEAASATA